MRVGILGSSGVGQTLAAGFSSKGHDVIVGTRDPKATMAQDKPNMMGVPPYSAFAKANPKVRLGTFQEAAKHAEVVVFCVNGKAALDVVKLAGPDNLAGKLVIDTTNPLDFGANGPFWPDSLRPSILQLVQKQAPKANFVKAWNCTPGAQMVNPKFKEGPGDQLLAGNDANAKQQAARILKEFGWNSLDVGDASTAGYVEGAALAVICFAAKGNDWGWGVKVVGRRESSAIPVEAVTATSKPASPAVGGGATTPTASVARTR